MGLVSNLSAALWTSPLVVRYDLNGAADTTFTSLGYVSEPCTGNVKYLFYSPALQSDEKIVYLRPVNDLLSPAMFRVNANGTPDNTFTPANINFGATQSIIFQTGVSKIVRLGTYFVNKSTTQHVKLVRYLS